jgi:hypothetical protein
MIARGLTITATASAKWRLRAKKLAQQDEACNWVRGFKLPSVVSLYRFKFIYCAAGAAEGCRKLIRGWSMLANAVGTLVTLFGLFGVGAIVCAIVWTLFAWGGRCYDWLLSFVTPLGLASIAGQVVCTPTKGPGDGCAALAVFWHRTIPVVLRNLP